MSLKTVLLSALLLFFIFSAGAYGRSEDGASQSATIQDGSDCEPDEAVVVVTRDDRIKGSAIKSRLLLDGREMGEITRGQTMQYCVAQGEKIIGVASDFFGGRGAQKRELAVDFKPDRLYAFRVFILHAQGAMIERTAL